MVEPSSAVPWALRNFCACNPIVGDLSDILVYEHLACASVSHRAPVDSVPLRSVLRGGAALDGVRVRARPLLQRGEVASIACGGHLRPIALSILTLLVDKHCQELARARCPALLRCERVLRFPE